MSSLLEWLPAPGFTPRVALRPVPDFRQIQALQKWPSVPVPGKPKQRTIKIGTNKIRELEILRNDNRTMKRLAVEEYIEQAFLFRTLADRLERGEALQDLLVHVKEEILATTQLPMAVDFLRAELNHGGAMAPAMKRLSHYFTPFQTFLVLSAEDERSRFGLHNCLRVLHHDAELRAKEPSSAAMFFFQFETLSRSRLDYHRGLEAVALDPQFDPAWREWITLVRRQVGLIDLADLVYVASEHYLDVQRKRQAAAEELPAQVLFGVKEGRIALANRRKDPLHLFEALQRQLGYPKVPKLEKREESASEQLLRLSRRLERIEARIKLLEDEQRTSGIDLTQFYQGRKPKDT